MTSHETDVRTQDVVTWWTFLQASDQINPSESRISSEKRSSFTWKKKRKARVSANLSTCLLPGQPYTKHEHKKRTRKTQKSRSTCTLHFSDCKSCSPKSFIVHLHHLFYADIQLRHKIWAINHLPSFCWAALKWKCNFFVSRTYEAKLKWNCETVWLVSGSLAYLPMYPVKMQMRKLFK